MIPQPPKRALQFLRWFCREEYLEEFEGDLVEFFEEDYADSPGKANRRFVWGVLRHFRPMFIRSFSPKLFPRTMIRHHFKISYRTLWRNKASSLINVGGLAIGMAVFFLISLWVQDELTFNDYHQDTHRIAQVMQHRNAGDQIQTWNTSMLPLADELKNKYGSDFEYVVRSSLMERRNFYFGDKSLQREGYYMEPEVPDLLSLEMLQGDKDGLQDPKSILISASFAEDLFGNENPIGQTLKVNMAHDLKVAGVYADIPANSSFQWVDFLAPWQQYLVEYTWIERMEDPWNSSSFYTYVKLAPHADLDRVNVKIRHAIQDNIGDNAVAMNTAPICFLHPMDKWKLYSRFENGKEAGGFIETVRMFGLIAFFVLLLACFNFVNLSTARSEKRAREVGVRKAIGSTRQQLMGQFFSESIMVSALAMVLALGIVHLSLPWFNNVADKYIEIDWAHPFFWAFIVGSTLVIGLLAGSYPALFLSSFKPIDVLRGTFRAGRQASTPRKVLVVSQFAVSTALIIGTITVFQQIQHGLDRPLGYNQSNLVTVHSSQADIRRHFPMIKNDLEQNRWAESVAKSSSPITDFYETTYNVDWRGKNPEQGANFHQNVVSADFGKTANWTLRQGRDFSADISSDSSAMIINVAAAEFMGLEHPIDEVVNLDGKDFRVIGVVENLLVESIFVPTRPGIYTMQSNRGGIMSIRLNPAMSADASFEKIESVVKAYDPHAVLNIRFADVSYGWKFREEKRVQTLSGVFALLAVLISCLGLFGLAAFVAERRAKEISIRKVLGASVVNLWALLSKDFLVLVLGSFVVAIPLAWYYLKDWLEGFSYRINLSLWVFMGACLMVLMISLLTVSFQSLRTATANPVKALKDE